MSRIFYRYPLLLACLLIAICSGIPGSLAENTSVLPVSLEGNTSVITMEANDTYILTMSEVQPNATIFDMNGNTTTIPLQNVLSAKTMSAAMFLSSMSGEKTVSMVKIVEPVYSAQNQTFMCRITPQRYYEGTLLSAYANTSAEIQPGANGFTHIVMESPVKISENGLICVDEGNCQEVPDSNVAIKRTTPLSGPGCSWDIINGVVTEKC